MGWLWRRIQRHAPVIAGAVVVVINLIALSGVLKLSDKVLGGINAAVAACLALIVAFLVSIQPYRVRRAYTVRAQRKPLEVVPGTGSLTGAVVGRETLCDVLMDDLRSRHTRRPYVVVGGPGAGKTALLVRLTSKLAAQGYVPVPIALRDAQENLDFREMARARFVGNEELAALSDADITKVWLRLCQDDKVVVLADGLEEALREGPPALDRENLIRLAIQRAYARRLPLVIASRPYEPLRGLDATVMGLGPLSEDAVLAWADSPAARGDAVQDERDRRRLHWLVDKADAAESPLYLKIIRDLNLHELLDEVVPAETALIGAWDRSTVRLRLLQAWEKALARGYLLPPQMPVRSDEFEITLDWLSALACIGLKNGSSEASLSDTLSPEIEAAILQSQPVAAAMPGERSLTGVSKRLAAAWGARLGLVEPRAGGVRFQHSLIQAYLGSRLMDMALTDDEYWQEALAGNSVPGEGPDRPRPGCEFLTALVLHSRCGAGQSMSNALAASGGQSRRVTPQEVCGRLLESARAHRDPKALEIFAAVLEIAGAAHQIGNGDLPGDGRARASADRLPMALSTIADAIKLQWPYIRSADLWTLEEAKIGLVRRFGEALRARSNASTDGPGEPGYAQLYAICCDEDSYRVRLAGAEEIGRGGCAAYEELRDCLAVPGTPGWKSSQQWARQVSAWVLPMLITSTHLDCIRRGQRGSLPAALRSALEEWARNIGIVGSGDHDDGGQLAIPEEIALAQGFKYAANQRRPYSPGLMPGQWQYLEEQALRTLKHARYWFTQLTLIQALCLWAMPDGYEQAGGRPPTRLDDIAERWLEVAGSKRDGKTAPTPRRHGRQIHPFVAAAADLAAHALESGEPSRFLWMDESDVVSQIGGARPTAQRHISQVWITPSMGWTTLDPRAQQLVADVMVLRDLAERSGATQEVESHLERASRNDLPPCITQDRRPLAPLHQARAGGDMAGSNCLDSCVFRLCPYPPMGMQPHRAELSEEFCRRQYRLARRLQLGRRQYQPARRLQLGRLTAHWQGMQPRKMREFWSQMAERARISPGP